MEYLQETVSANRLPLYELVLSGTQVNGEGLRFVDKIAGITSLDLSRLAIRDRDLDRLKDLKLGSLVLSQCPFITGSVIQHLKPWKESLGALELNHIYCHGALAGLKGFSVSKLALASSSIDASDLQNLRHLPKLVNLNIQDNPALDAEIKQVTQTVLAIPKLYLVSVTDTNLFSAICDEKRARVKSKWISQAEKDRLSRLIVAPAH
jgi:hypothetical protein